uniref:Homeobox domain-containing protein n=1 Tax=Steinernema glaseri TaxID=37863 RepID=A0A1I7ZBI3_9BILA
MSSSETSSSESEALEQNQEHGQYAQETPEDSGNTVPAIFQEIASAAFSHAYTEYMKYILNALSIAAPQIILQLLNSNSQATSSNAQPSNFHAPSSKNFDEQQKRYLKELFEETRYPSREQRLDVAKKAGLRLNQVTRWFQNQRQKQNRINRQVSASVSIERNDTAGEVKEEAPEEDKME